MLMPHLRTCLAAMVAALASAAAVAAPLPVKIERFEGEVVQVIGTVHSGVLPGKNLEQGTQIQTGTDGRADLSLSGAPTVSVGGNTDLLVHSVEKGALRLRVASGALRIDSRAAGPHQARDVRLNVGDLRLRISGAEGWTELSDRGGQVCLIAGAIDAQQPSGAVRLDVPGQCLRQSGLTAQWSMVPLSVLEERVALLGVRAPAVALEPKPEPKIKALPLPVEPEPAVVALVEPAPAAESPKPVAITPAVAPAHVVIEKAPAAAALRTPALPVETVAPVVKAAEPVAGEAKPTPPPVEGKPTPPIAVATAPVKDPEMPAASVVTMATPAPIETPVWPNLPVTQPKAPVVEPVAPTAKASAKPQSTPLPAAPSPVQAEAASSSAVTSAAGSSASPVDEAGAAKPAAQQVTEVALAAPAEPEPAVDDGRRWRVVLASMPERLKAETEAERLKARGWTVEAREYRVGDRHGYRIGFGEFAAREEAQKALEAFMIQAPDATAWLAKY
ncbi:sporulation related protein [Panacagrimonas perspica]|uniref:Sporulation related protein n=1 Tax=Panacagrimonas perspica TaxID=381431 RepID=A0A4S3K8Z9_9GAMM|nr:SPOR domain-containing protein [Panacagrimonas perspica]TDU24369.1 sporulation related protein [Panacagrimonas perspica]THD04757.1 hypothetical protein B1810_04965 [Panacagrimonas perspica]